MSWRERITGRGGNRRRPSHPDVPQATIVDRVVGYSAVVHRHGRRLVIEDGTGGHGRSVHVNVTLESCVSATIQRCHTEEGTLVLCLMLAVDLEGSMPGRLSLTATFPTDCEPQLEAIVREVEKARRPRADPEPTTPSTVQRTESEAHRIPREPLAATSEASEEEPAPPVPRRPEPQPLPLLWVARVPDTDDWLSFEPLAASAEIFPERPENPDKGDT